MSATSEISASAVKELREISGAGMMDCKKALTETKGDLEAAIDWLRKKGLAAASKKSGRTAAEGLIGVSTSGTVGAVIEVNAETDFVARNEKFQEYVETTAGLALAQGDNLQTLGGVPYPSSDKNVSEQLTHLIAVIGENMSLRRAKVLSVNQGVVSAYVHNAIRPCLGKIGVLVALESAGDQKKLESLGKQIAMHIAAAMPQARVIEDLDTAIVERERAIFAEQARQSGKPDDFITVMVEGRVRKFYEEVVLLEQKYLIDDSKRCVRDVVQDAAKELDSPITLTDFALFKLGEGIEKEVKDFASEVAEQLGK